MIGDEGRSIGFWTPHSGLVTKSNFSTNTESAFFISKSNIGSIIWPGNSTSIPKGWEMPTNGKKLRVGIPMDNGFPEFVKVVFDPITNATYRCN